MAILISNDTQTDNLNYRRDAHGMEEPKIKFQKPRWCRSQVWIILLLFILIKRHIKLHEDFILQGNPHNKFKFYLKITSIIFLQYLSLLIRLVKHKYETTSDLGWR